MSDNDPRITDGRIVGWIALAAFLNFVGMFLALVLAGLVISEVTTIRAQHRLEEFQESQKAAAEKSAEQIRENMQQQKESMERLKQPPRKK